jgi:3-isopropylmalate dehydrogenase
MYRKPFTIDATRRRLKEADMTTRLESAIARAIKEGKVRTYDMGGKASTLDVAKAIADYAS